MQNSKITVIIPFYKVENYIRQCLESVVNQTFENLEIICVDDCGKDNSLKIVEDFAKTDSRIKIVTNNKNIGSARSRNKGMDLAKGDYIFFLDADDYLLEKDVLEKLYKKIIETNSAVVVLKNDKLGSPSVGDYQVTLDNFEQHLFDFPVVVWGKIYSRKYLQEHNLEFINEKIILEDVGFQVKILSTFPKYSVIDSKGVFYRKNPNSVMHTRVKGQTHLQKKKALLDAIAFIEQNSKNAKAVIEKIKKSYLYSKYFDSWRRFFRFRWEKNEKHLEVLFVTLYKKKSGSRKSPDRILGIPIKSEKN